MRSSMSRRDALKTGGLGAALLLHPPLLSGCGGGAGGMGPDGGAPFQPPEYDPNVPWWLQHNYAPVDEREAFDLAIEGAIPPELDGLYLRNGSNPATGESPHWFSGDGMVHGIRIKDGKALWYRNRYVQTAVLAGGGGGVPGRENNPSNVSVLSHAGRVLTSGEVGFPYELSPADLGTVGPHDFDGALDTWFTAHPKVDPVTGEMLAFGYDVAPARVTYHRIDASGALAHSEPIDLPAPVMMHDFAITATRVLFLDLPIVFDLSAAIGGDGLPFRWDESHPARIGVMPRDGGADDLRWFEIDTCFIFHTLNAYDHPTRDGVVVLEAARHPKVWEAGPNDFGSRPALHRYEIDLVADRVDEQPLDDRMAEFVQVDRRLVGREHRYGYGVWLDESTGDRPGRFKGLLKWDTRTGASSSHLFSPELEVGEPSFVPAGAAAGEDHGYLMTYVYDWSRDRSALVLLDASDLGAAPIATIALPFRVPFGFHGLWVPA